VADFNSDHLADIGVTSGNISSVNIFLNRGDGTFPPTVSGSYASEGSSWGLFASDFNGMGTSI